MGESKSYYEPSHGSAPDIAGLNIANPYSMIGSVAMMLEMSFNMTELSSQLWNALHAVIESGNVTRDLSDRVVSGRTVTTEEFGALVISELQMSF